MAELFSNDFSTTLNGGINNLVTSLVVTSATGAPASGTFRIRIDNEIMTVTAVAGTTFTVVRASEPVAGVQTAASHSNLAAVDGVLTDVGLDNAVDERVATHTALQNAHHSQNHSDADHSFNITTAPVTIGTANAAGGGTNHAGALHVHAGLGAPLGLAGATAATRFVGATTSGAPVAVQPFVIGDYIIDRSGKVWVCTVAGSPGTWADVGGGGGVTYAGTSDLANVAAAESAGAATTVPRGDHVHAHGSGFLPDSHHSQAHGASDHTDVVRSIFIDAESLRGAGTTVPVNSSSLTTDPDLVNYWPLADTFDAGVRGSFMVPGDWVSGMGMQIYWFPSSTVVANVRFSATYKSLAAGDNVITAGTTATSWTAAVGTISILQIDTEQALATGVAANEMYRFTITRKASTDALDTYSGAVKLLGVRFNYTATG